MKKHVERLIEARKTAPVAGVDFDAWLLLLIMDALEPEQYAMLDWMLVGENTADPISTADLCDLLGTTPTRAGATLSRLRQLGLVQTTYRTDEHGRTAYHVPVEWVREAQKQTMRELRQAWDAILIGSTN